VRWGQAILVFFAVIGINAVVNQLFAPTFFTPLHYAVSGGLGGAIGMVANDYRKSKSKNKDVGVKRQTRWYGRRYV
jgi:phosphate starvation-inducible membrane PsiE